MIEPLTVSLGIGFLTVGALSYSACRVIRAEREVARIKAATAEEINTILETAAEGAKARSAEIADLRAALNVHEARLAKQRMGLKQFRVVEGGQA